MKSVNTYLGKTAIWTGLGFGVVDNYEKMLKGVTGLQRIDIEGDGQHSRLERMMIRVIEEVKPGIDMTSERTAMLFSTTKGNIANLGIECPEEGSDVYLHKMASRVCKAVGFVRKPIVVSNACISGVVAVVLAQRLINAGRYDDIIVVGGDEMTEFTTSGFMAFKSVSEQPCRPYDAKRDGLSLGEAAGAVVVSNDRKKSQGIVVAGGSMSNDANHISGPSRTGEPLAEAIRQAMGEPGIANDDISFVNAHGTATVYNDEMESKAINLAGLQDKPLNSLKPYIGHTLGASGLVEIAIAAEELRHGMVIGTKGFETLGTPMPLNVSAENRSVTMKHCVKSASGFGGCNAAVVLSLEEYSKERAVPSMTDVKCLHRCTMKNGELSVDGELVVKSEADFGTFARDVYHRQDANMKFFKMTDMCKMGYLASNYVLKDVDYNPYDIAIVMSNKSSSLDADLTHWRIQKRDNQPASPAAFVYTLPNIVMGEIAIKNGIKGETTFLVTDSKNDETAKDYARLLLSEGRYKYVLTGWCELLEGNYELDIELLTTKFN